MSIRPENNQPINQLQHLKAHNPFFIDQSLHQLRIKAAHICGDGCGIIVWIALSIDVLNRVKIEPFLHWVCCTKGINNNREIQGCGLSSARAGNRSCEREGRQRAQIWGNWMVLETHGQRKTEGRKKWHFWWWVLSSPFCSAAWHGSITFWLDLVKRSSGQSRQWSVHNNVFLFFFLQKAHVFCFWDQGWESGFTSRGLGFRDGKH